MVGCESWEFVGVGVDCFVDWMYIECVLDFVDFCFGFVV